MFATLCTVFIPPICIKAPNPIGNIRVHGLMGSRPILGGANSLKMVPDAAQMKIASLFAFLPQDLGVQGLQGCQPQPRQLSKTTLSFKHWTSQVDFKFIQNSTYGPKSSVLFIVNMLRFVKPSLPLFFHRLLCDSGLGQEINLTRKQSRGNSGAKEPPVIFLKRWTNFEEHKQRCLLSTKSLHNDLCLDLSRTVVSAEFKFWHI